MPRLLAAPKPRFSPGSISRTSGRSRRSHAAGPSASPESTTMISRVGGEGSRSSARSARRTRSAPPWATITTETSGLTRARSRGPCVCGAGAPAGTRARAGGRRVQLGRRDDHEHERVEVVELHRQVEDVRGHRAEQRGEQAVGEGSGARLVGIAGARERAAPRVSAPRGGSAARSGRARTRVDADQPRLGDQRDVEAVRPPVGAAGLELVVDRERVEAEAEQRVLRRARAGRARRSGSAPAPSGPRP